MSIVQDKIILSKESAIKAGPQTSATEWINLISPSIAELSRVLKKHQLPEDALQRARGHLNQLEDDTILLKIDIPRKNLPRSKVPYQISHLTLLVKEDTVITIADQDSFLFTYLEHEHLVTWAEKDPTDFVYRILDMTTTMFINLTKALIQEISVLETNLKREFNNKSVYKLIDNNKSLLYFAKALNRNIKLLKSLAQKSVLKADYEQDLALQDLITKTEQAESVATIYQANVRNLMDAYSALIENNLSLSVQYLTILVTVATVPMAIGGIYGMNIPLPWQESPYALTGLAVIAGIIIVGALIFFRSKKMI